MNKFMLLNTKNSYGWVAIFFHWLSVFMIAGLFIVGIIMVDLDYYSPWYHKAPFFHKSFGLLFFCVLMARIAWRFMNQSPKKLTEKILLRYLSQILHVSFYILMFILVVSGYLIASADSKDIGVFNWFSIPGVNIGINNQEDIAGQVHEVVGWMIVVLASLHALMALKHHFIDKDATLKRMLGL